MSNMKMKLLGYMPLGLLKAISDVNPLIVNYHMVSDSDLPYISPLYHYRNVQGFIDDIQFLKKHYHPLSMPDFLEHRRNGIPLPPNSVMVTFDDGFREIYDIVGPVLYERSFPATFFLTKNFIDNKELNYDNKKSLIIDHLNKKNDLDIITKVKRILGYQGNQKINQAILSVPVTKRNLVDEICQVLKINIDEFLATNKPYMTRSQIFELRNGGFAFGGHSVDHSNYAEIQLNEQIFQTIESADYVANTFNLEYRIFAFPYSDLKISAAFFNAIEGKINATFGTHGLHDDTARNNFQRISVEKEPYKAEDTIKFFYTRRKIYQALGRNIIHRD